MRDSLGAIILVALQCEVMSQFCGPVLLLLTWPANAMARMALDSGHVGRAAGA